MKRSTAPGSSTPALRGGETKKNSQEEVAHKVAWAAVEQVYEKGAGGEWRRKEGRHIRSCSGQSCLPGARTGERSCGTTHPATNIFQ
ncbi:ChaB family protein [Methanoculleus chikugoensis]|uniref:ChaB family protein n=1 Tax=Methanoculleus chikugoensis TaxID=118126 RepID=UPI003CC88E86